MVRQYEVLRKHWLEVNDTVFHLCYKFTAVPELVDSPGVKAHPNTRLLQENCCVSICVRGEGDQAGCYIRAILSRRLAWKTALNWNANTESIWTNQYIEQ